MYHGLKKKVNAKYKPDLMGKYNFYAMGILYEFVQCENKFVRFLEST